MYHIVVSLNFDPLDDYEVFFNFFARHLFDFPFAFYFFSSFVVRVLINFWGLSISILILHIHGQLKRSDSPNVTCIDSSINKVILL